MCFVALNESILVKTGMTALYHKYNQFLKGNVSALFGPSNKFYNSGVRAYPLSNRKIQGRIWLAPEMLKILLQIASFSSAYLDMLPKNPQFSQRIFNISDGH